VEPHLLSLHAPESLPGTGDAGNFVQLARMLPLLQILEALQRQGNVQLNGPASANGAAPRQNGPVPNAELVPLLAMLMQLLGDGGAQGDARAGDASGAANGG
jgi:hypothetical protein